MVKQLHKRFSCLLLRMRTQAWQKLEFGTGISSLMSTKLRIQTLI